MTFSRTTDMRAVRELLTEARSWRRMTDDAAPSPESFQPAPRDRLVYVLCHRGAQVVALFVLVSNFHEAEVHFCFSPEVWGRTKEIGRAFLDWVWRETSLNRLVAPCPAHNRLALKLAKACGFTEIATERDAVQKNDRLYDRIILERSREDQTT